jgi:hypothetical protein
MLQQPVALKLKEILQHHENCKDFLEPSEHGAIEKLSGLQFYQAFMFKHRQEASNYQQLREGYAKLQAWIDIVR